MSTSSIVHCTVWNLYFYVYNNTIFHTKNEWGEGGQKKVTFEKTLAFNMVIDSISIYHIRCTKKVEQDILPRQDFLIFSINNVQPGASILLQFFLLIFWEQILLIT